MAIADKGSERLCWSAWPCPKCSGGVSPISYLIKRIGAGAQVSARTPEEVGAIQAGELLKFAQGCAHIGPTGASLPIISGGSEHLVFLDESAGKVIKVTRPGIYGDWYYLREGIVHQENCSPAEYLLRLRFWRKLFHSAPRALGITDSGQIVSSQKFFTGELPTQAAVDSFLEEAGLAPVRKDLWLWKRGYAETEVWLGDARADNFVRTRRGLVPIDIRLWQARPLSERLPQLRD